MSQEAQRADIAKKKVVLQMPGADSVNIRRDVPYSVVDGETLTIDLYYPPEWTPGAHTPAVLFVTGYSDVGMQAMLGCKAKELASYVSWGELVAASGMIAITYEARQPTADLQAVLQYAHQRAGPLGIDENRIGIWSCSGNVPNALSVLLQDARDSVRCAVLCYGYMLDFDGATAVAEAAGLFRFANPCAGKSVDDLAHDRPLFIARAGRDEMPGLNETIDRFAVRALQLNLPITLANHHAAQHAFDIRHDSDISREIIRQILAFMRFHLGAA